MTYVKDDILTVNMFSKVPALGPSLAALSRPPHSAGNSSVDISQIYHSVVKRDEPCFVTKSILYTHEIIHFVNDVRGDNNLKADVEDIIIDMGIAGEYFYLNQPSNRANLDPFIHKSLDSYAFIAITGSRETLETLIEMVKSDNIFRQGILDTQGQALARRISYGAACFKNPVYELVALEPEHFLAYGAAMNVYDHKSNTFKSYVASPDRKLREFPGNSSCLSLPAFTFVSERPPGSVLNPFLVVLNAEIKFRRYRRQYQSQPPSIPLPDDVQQLIDLTIELVELLYWKPVRAATKDRGPEVVRRRHPRRLLPWPEDADLETRITIGQATLAGHNLPYDSDEEEFIKERLTMPYPVGTPPIYRRHAKPEASASHQDVPPHA